MLDIIKQRIENILTDVSTIDLAKIKLRKMVEDIESYQSSNETLSDLHRTFRAVDEYKTMYNQELIKYGAIDSENILKRSLAVQGMLLTLAMMGSLLENILGKYNAGGDKSTIQKYLRKINDENEFVKSEKILWQSTLKSLTTIIQWNTEKEISRRDFAE